MVEAIDSNVHYKMGFREGKTEQLRADISLIREIAFQATNFEDFKIKLRNEIRKMDPNTWF